MIEKIFAILKVDGGGGCSYLMQKDIQFFFIIIP